MKRSSNRLVLLVGIFLAVVAFVLIAVMFQNRTGDPSREYFSDGLAAALIQALTRALARIKAETGARLLFGASRKSSIAKIDPQADVDHRLGGSLALALYAARAGADMLRVHDVRETVQALKVQRALEN